MEVIFSYGNHPCSCLKVPYTLFNCIIIPPLYKLLITVTANSGRLSIIYIAFNREILAFSSHGTPVS